MHIRQQVIFHCKKNPEANSEQVKKGQSVSKMMFTFIANDFLSKPSVIVAKNVREDGGCACVMLHSALNILYHDN